MPFQKGHKSFYKGKKRPMPAWNKGLKGFTVSNETKLKMRLSRLGKVSGMKGKKHSEETRKKMSIDRSGNKSYRWKGGILTDRNGYIYEYCPNHPSTVNVHVPQHRLIMEKKVGRYLFKHETVHHKNGIRNDNRIENLELWSSSHPKGQRIEDKIKWAKEFLEQYSYKVEKA